MEEQIRYDFISVSVIGLKIGILAVVLSFCGWLSSRDRLPHNVFTYCLVVPGGGGYFGAK